MERGKKKGKTYLETTISYQKVSVQFGAALLSSDDGSLNFYEKRTRRYKKTFVKKRGPFKIEGYKK